jgi:NAD-dependent dihydropyrimidine dehydrogenase PreA subunit
MKRAVTNYFVDVVIGLAFLVAAVSSIVFLLPSSWVSVSSAGQTSLVSVDMATWSFLHKWSGIVMIAGVVLHTLLHTRWIASMTRRVFGGRPQPRPSGAVAVTSQGAMAASVPAYRAAAGETRPRATAAPQSVHPLTTPAAPLEAARPVRPRACTEPVSARASDGGPGSGDEPRRLTRKAFLGAAATAVAGAAVIGVALRSGGTDVEIEQSSNSNSSTSGQVAQSQSSGGSSTSSSAASGSSTQQAAARVVVDSGRCSGCGHCLQACPQGVFAFDSSSGAALAASPDSCTLCGRCVQVCQPQAITLNA